MIRDRKPLAQILKDYERALAACPDIQQVRFYQHGVVEHRAHFSESNTRYDFITADCSPNGEPMLAAVRGIECEDTSAFAVYGPRTRFVDWYVVVRALRRQDPSAYEKLASVVRRVGEIDAWCDTLHGREPSEAAPQNEEEHAIAADIARRKDT